MTGKPPRRCLNSNALKFIAIITMLIDHGAVVFIENRIPGGALDFASARNSKYISMWWTVNEVMRLIGRLAFPIFCFLIIEGFFHTRNVKKYAGRLFIFAIISEIPFDLAIFDTWFFPQYQNVFITLFLGLAGISAVNRFEKEGSLWKQAAAVALCCGLAHVLKADYGAFGVFFIFLLYYCRMDTRMQTILGSLVLLWELTAPLAFVPIRMYNGERGDKRWKWFFYIFYPAHFLFLAGIRAVLP